MPSFFSRLTTRRFLFGSRLVETDLRLFCTLVRFDAVHDGHQLIDPEGCGLDGFGRLEIVRQCAALHREGVDLVIPVDYPGFNLRLARHAKASGIPVLYYIAPQVWAWHRSRIHELARVANRLLVLAAVVLAAGNDGLDRPGNLSLARAAFPWAILVGALDATGAPWAGTNRPETNPEGYHYAWQPGVDVPTATATGAAAIATGTSFAAPIETARLLRQRRETASTSAYTALR